MAAYYPEYDRHDFDGLLKRNIELEKQVAELEKRLIVDPSIYSGKMFPHRAVFLDRDGTLLEIIERPHHVKKRTAPYKAEELVFVPDVQNSIDRLRIAGFLTIMVTNQPDVRHGYMSEEEWQKIHKTVLNFLGLDDFIMSRHTREEECKYRKPSPEMLFAMAGKWGINPSKSYMIGDTDQRMWRPGGRPDAQRFYWTGITTKMLLNATGGQIVLPRRLC